MNDIILLFILLIVLFGVLKWADSFRLNNPGWEEAIASWFFTMIFFGSILMIINLIGKIWKKFF